MTFDLTLTFHVTLKRNFYYALESSRSGLSIAASPASLRLLVRELGRGAEYAPPSGARSAEYPSGARVNG